MIKGWKRIEIFFLFQRKTSHKPGGLDQMIIRMDTVKGKVKQDDIHSYEIKIINREGYLENEVEL